MTNKEKALMLVWEHYNISVYVKITYKYFVQDFKKFGYKSFPHNDALKHAKLTASKIAEYNPEEGRMLLEELEKI